ncbi:prominin-like protein isoform X2 [Venturia canescens]|uniref:prominin-like protein isoform X2 n=1 Tax=Venturia canescens TaxID=32260 RepID=UPI001C9BD60F|nr:prominin-like protein isoform X2 [Venturia canescens]
MLKRSVHNALRCCTFWFVLCIVLADKSGEVDGQDNENVGGGNLATRMRAISEDLDRQLQDVMASQAINFTMVNTTGLPYNATTKFNPKGMGQLYNVTNKFIDFVQSKQAIPEGIITVQDRQLRFADPAKEWQIIVTHYMGLTGLAATGLLIAIILPCVGLFFCCCRCAGQCGARSQPFDKKHDHCRKVMLSVLLIGVATIILFGVVCAFVTNEYMQEGIEEFPDQTRTNLEDLELYMTITKLEINNLLRTNYAELETTLNNILQASGKIVTEELAIYSHAESLTNLNDIVSGLDIIRGDLQMMNKITQDLRTNASQLDIVVRGVKKELLYTLSECKTHACAQVLQEYKINQMSVQVEFDKLPELKPSLHNITLLMESDIVSEVSQGRESFLRIQKDIQHAVNQTIPVVSSCIRKAGAALAKVAFNVTSLIDRINRDFKGVYRPHLRIAKDHIEQYSLYRYYLGLAVSGVLLTVLMCLTFGLLCGICGKRPDGYGDDCCNKGAGARFLMMAVWVIFLFTSILMVVTVTHMVTGAVAQRGICEPLQNPKDNRIFTLADKWVQIKKLLYPDHPEADINMNWIVSTCHRNESLYKVLKLEYIMDLDSLRKYAEKYSISSTIDQLRKMINLSPGVVILSESAMLKLNDLAQSGLSDIKFYQYAELLKDNITNINLKQLAEKLRDISHKLPSSQESIRDSLLKNAHDLEHYHKDLVMPMAALSEELSDSALILQDHIKFNHESMADAIHSLVNEVITAQQFLNEAGPEYVQHLATKFGDALIQRVNEFLEHLIKSIRDQIGRCGPVSNAYNATLVAGCKRVLDPFNGFWASVGWCLILFLPTIVLCVKLGSLYQKSDPYPGPLVESEYLYDAYADRDNIPLAQVHDKKYVSQTRQHTNAFVENYDGPASSYSGTERIAEVYQGSSQHDPRYSEHEPKTWVYPNGGPPRYAPPVAAPPLSTEYERPPPYYFPGPGVRD